MNGKMLDRLLSNAENRFFYYPKNNIIHDSKCHYLKNIPIENLEVMSELSPGLIYGKLICRCCGKRIALRHALRGKDRDSSAALADLLGCLNMLGAAQHELIKLFIMNGASVVAYDFDYVALKVNDDNWVIEKAGGGIRLLHNNYIINKDYSRSFPGGYHVQTVNGKQSFGNFVRLMCSYSYEYHRQQAEKYDNNLRAARFEVELALLDNYSSGRKKGLLHDYYIFVDICDTVSMRFKSYRYLGIKHSEEDRSGEYSVIKCRIPKCLRKRFVTMMSYLKSIAKEESRTDYLQFCQNKITQIS